MPTSRDSLDIKFLASQGAPVWWHGQLVHQTYESPPLHDGDRIEIRFTDTNALHPQGLLIDVEDGFLEIRSKTLNRIVLWAETAPDVASATVKAESGTAPKIRVWNCWRDDQGQIDEWSRDAGMLLDGDLKNGLTLRCGDEFGGLAPGGEPSFGNLVVSMRRIRP